MWKVTHCTIVEAGSVTANHKLCKYLRPNMYVCKAIVCVSVRYNPRLRNSVFHLSGFSQNAILTPPNPRVVRGIAVVWQNCWVTNIGNL